MHRILIDTNEYPQGLYDLDAPPKVLTATGPFEAERTIAIVGSRNASEEAADFAFALAYHLARAGVVVVSGGAIGIDRAAHEGAMAGGGATLCVFGAGYPRTSPSQNDDLFAAIEGAPRSRLVWPFSDGTELSSANLRRRNNTIVGLSTDVVVIQAFIKSGSRNAARLARRFGRNLWLVPGAPWDPAFSGTIAEGAAGARALWSIPCFFEALDLPLTITDANATRRATLPSSFLATPPTRPSRRSHIAQKEGPSDLDSSSWTENEKLVFSKTSGGPTHRDDLVHQTGLPASATITALLTLSLKDVVVEGPDGFFRRTKAR